ncbi:transposase [Escherichia coli]|nr:transposase [Escherichia coli]OEI32245.1 transposase [Escherichia coli]OEI47287.1 transposase [Escherichia coli]OEI56985.1 transposase [Escherichia coli]
MNIKRIGLDLAKTFFRSTALITMKKWYCEKGCAVPT